ATRPDRAERREGSRAQRAGNERDSLETAAQDASRSILSGRFIQSFFFSLTAQGALAPRGAVRPRFVVPCPCSYPLLVLPVGGPGHARRTCHGDCLGWTPILRRSAPQ